MQITILTNTLYQGNRLLADQVVDVPDEEAKKFCDALVAVPLFAEDLEKMGMSIDEEAVVDETEAEVVEETAEPEQEVVEQVEETEVVEGEEVVEETAEPKQEVAENKGNKKGKK